MGLSLSRRRCVPGSHLAPPVLRGTIGLLGLLFGVGTAFGQEVRSDPIPDHRLYVCVQNEASIAIVDMDALEIVRVVRLEELGFAATAAPHDVTVSEDGQFWYVGLVGEHQVLQFTADDQLRGRFEMETPGMLKLSPSGGTLAITRSMSATDPPRLVGLAETAEMGLEEVDVLFPRPHALTVSRDGRFVYTASLGTNQLASIELSSERVVLTEVPGPPHAFVQLAISPDAGTLVASGELSGQLLVFGLEDPSRPRLLSSTTVGPRPFDPVFSPDGRSLWVPIKGADEVVILETTDWSVSDRISGQGISQPHAIEFSPDGRRAFVTNNAPPGVRGQRAQASPGAMLVVIDTEAREIEGTLELGQNLTGLGRRGGG